MNQSNPSELLTTRRDRRIERQRRQIMDAAAQVFAEKGYAATTTKDIALAADVGESTLYNYFENKRDILLGIAAYQEARLDKVFQQAVTMETRQQMVDVFVAVMDIVLSQSHYIRALIGEAWVNDEILNNHLVVRLSQISDFLQNFIAKRVASGAFRPVDARLGARMVIAEFIGAILPALRGVEPQPDPRQRRELAEGIIALWIDGVNNGNFR
ncbi:MAG TPA: TetR/AcrR family transcriptional regulator [Anaerolineaceae bacterium]|nr:TetR/AcrR family transcriptional regulator [Anaerolineaceae bacterium]